MINFNRYILAAAFALTASGALAADIAVEEAPVAPPVADSGLTGALYLYGWVPWVDGDVGVNGLGPVDVSLDPKDIIDALDMAFIAAGEVRSGPVGVFGDLLYLDTSSTEATPFQIIYNSATLEVTQTIATAMLTYQLYESGENWVQGLAGVRYVGMDSTLSLDGGDGFIFPKNPSADENISWWDPMFGIRVRQSLGGNWFFTGGALVGGFGVGSNLDWDVNAGLAYKFTDNFSVAVTYRAMGFDYEEDGDVIDLVNQAPLIAFALTF
jgi:opacity protein-like surface antigen